MTAPDYDVITVGGGLGGATLARVMAGAGARVLVLERERQFRDRVRGELLVPWGVAEARALGVYDLLRAKGGRELRWNDMYVGGMQVVHRDLPATTASGQPWTSFYHPDMQETVLAAAADAGAEVQRGVRVRNVTPGAPSRVTVESDAGAEELSARLVVGADGRGSAVRQWAGFASQRDPDRLLFAGVLLDDHAAPEEAGSILFNPAVGRVALFFPQGDGRVRAYVGYHKDTDPPRGALRTSPEHFIEQSVRAGTPQEWYARTRVSGPLAMFDGADSWVPHPYRDGVALVGDAAATSDPTWGQGMSLTLRDVRVLRECLAATDDWDAAGHAYAAAHDRHYGVIHTVDGWYADLFMEIGPEADARRERAFPLIAADESRIPDAPLSGPDQPADDRVRRRFFGEE